MAGPLHKLSDGGSLGGGAMAAGGDLASPRPRAPLASANENRCQIPLDIEPPTCVPTDLSCHFSAPHPPPSPLTRRTLSEDGGDDNMHHMHSPPLLKRRAFSHDCEARRQAVDAHSSDDVTDGGGLMDGYASSGGPLRTIPSQLEMDEDDDSHDGVPEHPSLSTPTRLFPHRSVLHRDRAATSDVVLNMSDVLPRYDDNLASQIANIHDVDGGRQEQQRWESPQRGASFSTPERPSARPSINRERANTCPQRPQRHSTLFEGGDEEAGHLAEGVPSPAHHGMSVSPGRRRPQTAPQLSVAIPSLATPSSGRRSRPRPPTSSSSAPSTTPHIVSIPGSPQVGGRLTSRTSSLSASSITPQLTERNCIFRINHHVMKALMVLSLYMLLAYTWNTDLRARYKSVEINYGLSEYWHGGLSSQFGKTEKIGRNTGKLFNDDGDDEGIAKLINGLVDDKLDSASGDSLDSSEDALLLQGGSLVADGRRRRPSLSFARSANSHSGYGTYQRRTAGRGGWTMSKVAWGLVWLGFALPVAEAGVREVRRQMNFRMWSVRATFRAASAGGRMNNVHDL